MNTAYYIARRLAKSRHTKSSISAPIIKIGIAAVAIGVIMMIISVSTGLGLQKKIREKVAAFNGHIIISNYDNNLSEVSKIPVSIQQDFYPEFKAVKEVVHIQAVASKAGIVRTGDAVEGILFKGVGADYNWAMLQEYLTAGKLPDVKSGGITEEVMISEYLAKRMQLEVGDKLPTYFRKDEANDKYNTRVFKVAGIYNSGFQEFDASYVFGDIRHVQRINKWQSDEVGAFEVFISDFSRIGEVGELVYAETPSDLDTQTIEERYYYIFEWLTLFDFNIIVILIIMISVATVNMVVALLVLILERTQMIGILKAIGAGNWLIRKIFLYNAAHIMIRGLSWGNLIGITLLLVQIQFEIITLNPESYYVNVAPVDFNLFNILLINLLTLLISVCILVIPSYIITRVTPVKAMRFD